MSTFSQANKEILEGQKAIGFDYQFDYFVFRALQLKEDESIGYEVLDDVHLEKADGTTILFQLKHSSQRKQDGTIKNLTDLDNDLWHTLYNWANKINTIKDFLDRHSFVLVSNKNENSNGNQFIDLLYDFKKNGNLREARDEIELILKSTNSENIKREIYSVLNLSDKSLGDFLRKIQIDLNVDDIIVKSKKCLIDYHIQEKDVDKFYKHLFSQLKRNSFEQIKATGKFILTKTQFSIIYNQIHSSTISKIKLPKRDFGKIEPPANLEELNFAKQLIDIKMVSIASLKQKTKLIQYCVEMLHTDKYITFWLTDSAITYADIQDYKDECVRLYNNIFDRRYRNIDLKCNSGTNINELEEEINETGVQIVYDVRELNVNMSNYDSQLGIEFNNGFFWLLSNKLEIGWHYDWQNRYK